MYSARALRLASLSTRKGTPSQSSRPIRCSRTFINCQSAHFESVALPLTTSARSCPSRRSTGASEAHADSYDVVYRTALQELLNLADRPVDRLIESHVGFLRHRCLLDAAVKIAYTDVGLIGELNGNHYASIWIDCPASRLLYGEGRAVVALAMQYGPEAIEKARHRGPRKIAVLFELSLRKSTDRPQDPWIDRKQRMITQGSYEAPLARRSLRSRWCV
jgi:hypothetical protein